MASFVLLGIDDFDDFDLGTSGGADGSFALTGGVAHAGLAVANGHGQGFGSFALTGVTTAFDTNGGATGSFTLIGDAVGHIQTGHAVAEGDFGLAFETDSGANLIVPQFAFADGFYYVSGFSYASFHERSYAYGSFGLRGYAANFNYREVRGVFEVIGLGMDLSAHQFRATMVATGPHPQLLAIAEAGLGLTGVRGVHSGLTGTARTGAVSVGVLPSKTFTASATTTILTSTIANLPVGTLVASAVNTTLAQVTGTHTGLWTVYARTGATSTKSLPVGSFTATSTPSILARVDVRLPKLSLTAHAYRDNTGQVIGILPPLTVVSSGVMRAIGPKPVFVGHAYVEVTLVYEGFSITLRDGKDGNTETLTTAILNCPFEQIVRFGNTYLGAAADGLFEIGTDSAVDSVVRLAPDDFGTPTLKRPIALHLSGRIESHLNVSLSVEEDTWLAPQATTSKDGASNHRARLARGVSGRYLSYALTNPGGGDFELDEVSPENHILHRRLGGRNG